MFEVRQSSIYRDWFDRLRDRQAKMRIDARISRLAMGNAGDAKSVGSGVSELRVDYGPGIDIERAIEIAKHWTE